jgi:hypothetical protein
LVTKLTFEQFIRSVKKNKAVTHSMLLGAGASIASGIDLVISEPDKLKDFIGATG